jgi:hypothetical protein
LPQMQGNQRNCVSFTISFIEFDSVVQTFLIDDIVSNGNTAKNNIITIPIIVGIEGLFTIRQYSPNSIRIICF